MVPNLPDYGDQIVVVAMNILRRITLLTAAFLSLLAKDVSFAQAAPRSSIRGTVYDDSTGAPLANVNVFIAGTMMGAATDEDGSFVIRNLLPGLHPVTASRVGYSIASQLIRVIDSSTTMTIRMKPKVLQMPVVEVRAADPVEWKKHMEKFRQFFLGGTPNATHCVFLNPEILEFNETPDRQFEASATEPLQIENNALGYRLYLHLEKFTLDQGWLIYSWRPRFQELQSSSEEELVLWEGNRRRTYNGSLQHFLASLVEGRARREGFVLYKVLSPKHAREYPQARINVDELEIVLPSSTPNERILRFRDYLQVEYERRTIVVGYGRRGEPMTRSKTSWLTLAADSVTINTNGQYLEPFALKLIGDWASERLADTLPAEYRPTRTR